MMMAVCCSLLLTACGSEDENITEQNPIYIDAFTDDSVIDFMNEEWPKKGWTPGFFKGDGKESFCKVINSEDDFVDFYIGNKEVPYIDFVANTLIVGQVQVPHTGFEIKKVELFQSDSLDLNVYLEEKEGGYTMLTALRFWKLYSKVSGNMSMNIIKTN